MTSLARRSVPATAMLIMVALAACSSGDPVPPSTDPPPTDSHSSTPASTSSSADPQADLRTRLAAALRDQYSYRADVVERPLTTLTLVDAPWLSGAVIVDVVNSDLAHPRRFFAGVGAEEIGVVLTGEPLDFNALTAASTTEVDSAKAAQAVAGTYLDTTRDFVRWSYRVTGVDDIGWLRELSADQLATRAEIEQAYATKIAKPAATRVGDDWQLRAWMVNGNKLVSHDLTIARGGAVTDKITTAYDGLPVPDSV